MKRALGLVAALPALAALAVTQPAAPAWAEPADAAPCSSAQIVVTAGGADAAVGHRRIVLVFTLAGGATPCTLTGYPAVESGAGGPPIHAEPTPRGYMGGLPTGVDEPPIVTLMPWQHGQAIVEGMSVSGEGTHCPTYTEVRVSPPGAIDFVTVPATIDSCQWQVHPVIAA